MCNEKSIRSLKVLVVGTGSIGRRHIRNLLVLGCSVSAYRYRPREAHSEGEQLLEDVNIVESLNEAVMVSHDAVVVANNTDKHMDVALMAARLGKAIFIEKPLGINLEGTQSLLDLVSANKLVVEAGYMMRCHPNLRWLKQQIQQGSIGEVRYLRAAVGQWLPDWRPGSDHTQGYGAKRGVGGVIFDLIHELDIVQWLAGDVRHVNAMTAMVDELCIDTEAIAQMGLCLANGILAQVHVDYIRPSFHRTLEVIGQHGEYHWDFLSGTVSYAARGGRSRVVHSVAPTFERNMLFSNHMHHFLSRIQNMTLQPISSLDDSVRTLKVALACHEAAQTGHQQTLY